MKSNKKIVLIATLLLFIGVILGAFGAHSLKEVLTEESMVSFETGVRYQFFGSLILIAFIGLSELKKLNYGVGLKIFLFGTILFSFSIYGLVFFKLFALPYLIFVPLTPIGGSLLLVGLGSIFIKIYKEWQK
jgi:uncharacterized membrane protein YgdD (TMEM256/DUF423 family)